MLMTPIMVAEWRGYGKLYESPSEFYGVWGMLLSIAVFIVWTGECEERKEGFADWNSLLDSFLMLNLDSF
jgi:hypothetical protein